MIFKRIKDLREDHDLTQKQVADILKIMQPSYNRYERGEQDIPVKHVITLAIFYKVSTDYILGLSNKKDR